MIRRGPLVGEIFIPVVTARGFVVEDTLCSLLGMQASGRLCFEEVGSDWKFTISTSDWDLGLNNGLIKTIDAMTFLAMCAK